jgi:hypothetical protein
VEALVNGPPIGGPEWRASETPATPHSVLADVLHDHEQISDVHLQDIVWARTQVTIDTANTALQMAIIEQLSGDSWIGLYPLRLGGLVEEKPWPVIRENLAFNALYCAVQRKLHAAGRKIGPKS